MPLSSSILQPFGYAIRSFGPLTIRSTCFVGNMFHNFAPVQAFGGVEVSGNYGTTNQRDLSCQFVAGFDTQDDFNKGTPKCVDYDLKACPFKTFPTNPPVPAPSPTEAPVTNQGSDNPADSAKGPSSNAPSQYLFSSVLCVVVLAMAVSML
jgi:hypothetical protein